MSGDGPITARRDFPERQGIGLGVLGRVAVNRIVFGRSESQLLGAASIDALRDCHFKPSPRARGACGELE